MRQTKTYSVRYLPDEDAAIKRAAGEGFMKIATWIRSVTVKEARRAAKQKGAK